MGPGHRVLAEVVVALARALFRIRVEGADHVPRDRGAVIVSNHVSAFDGIILSVVVWWKRRRVPRFVTGAEFFRNPVFGATLRAFGQIPIRRGERDAGAIDGAIEAASAGSIVGVFPEGRVNPEAEGPLQQGRAGAARIALASDAPVIPTAIWGTQHRWPKSGLRWSRPFRPVVVVRFGPPVALDGDGSYEDARAATGVVMASLEREVAAARANADG
jgi:1-acyl-sn-glycerol-3-phosphate acyltransferase